MSGRAFKLKVRRNITCVLHMFPPTLGALEVYLLTYLYVENLTQEMTSWPPENDNKIKIYIITMTQRHLPLSLRSRVAILAACGKQSSSTWLPPVPSEFPLRFNSTFFTVEFDEMPSNTLLTDHKPPRINIHEPACFCLPTYGQFNERFKKYPISFSFNLYYQNSFTHSNAHHH